MNETLSVINFSYQGTILIYVIMKNDSGRDTIISHKSCESIDLLISDIIKPADEELYSKTQEHIKEVIIVLSDSFAEVTQNRGYIVRDFETEISNSDINRLLNDMNKIHPYNGAKVLNIAPLSIQLTISLISKILQACKASVLKVNFRFYVEIRNWLMRLPVS